LPEFRSEFPNVTIELLLSDDNLDLVAERIDLAIRMGPSITADVIGMKLFDTRYRVCASPGFLRKGPSLKQPQDLAAMCCLLYTFGEFRRRWLFRDAKGAVSEIPVHGDILISNALALRETAVQGLGPALLADWLISEQIRNGSLVDLFPSYCVTATSFNTAAWLLYPSRSYLPNKVRAMIGFLKGKARKITMR
jgi:DNA-binding transcriptional LysR family regulator